MLTRSISQHTVPLTRYLRAVRRAVLGITAMKRMSTLAALAHPSHGELQANIVKYKEESEKEDINEVRASRFFWATAEHQLTGSGGCTSSQPRRRSRRGGGNWSGVDIACAVGEGPLSAVEDRSCHVMLTFPLI